MKSYVYDYDAADNRTAEAIDSLVTGDTLNNLNQLTSRQGGTGVLPIRGTTNEPSSSVTVNGTAAIVKSDNSFEGKASVTAGDNTVTVAATDVNGNTATNRYNLTVTGSGSKTLVYDQNGNLTSDGTRTFEWDPMNRLTAVNSGTNRSEFTYNGLSQRVKIMEKDNGSLISTKQFVWCPGGAQPCEERDVGNSVAKRYYPQGMQVGSTNYYYTRDHLGSIHELADSSGAVQTRYEYDPYGRRTRLTGTLDADFGFTGHYYHQPSGLHLALYRAYNADLGRWISRDPLPGAEISQGPNLNTYVLNNPINYLDFDGRQTGRAALTRQETIDILYDGDEDRYNKDIRDGNATLKAAQDLTVDCMLSTVPMPKPTGNRLKDYLIDKVLGELIGDFIKGFLPSYNGPPEPNQPTPGPHPTPYPR